MFDSLLTTIRAVAKSAATQDVEAFLRNVSRYSNDAADALAKLREGHLPMLAAAGTADPLEACLDELAALRADCEATPVMAAGPVPVGIGPAEILAFVQLAQAVIELIRKRRQGG